MNKNYEERIKKGRAKEGKKNDRKRRKVGTKKERTREKEKKIVRK